jgi:hypothetical protein
MTQTDRQEHLDFCKTRALEYIELNDLDNAIASMRSDLSKHPGTNNQKLINQTIEFLFSRPLTTESVRNWITGFN